jgi:hypothetical protein
MRLETQLGGILQSSLTGEIQKAAAFNKFLSYLGKKKQFYRFFVSLFTKISFIRS